MKMRLASLFYLALDENCLSVREVDPLFDRIGQLAKQTAALNRSLDVKSSKTPFPRTRRAAALNPRRSTLD